MNALKMLYEQDRVPLFGALRADTVDFLLTHTSTVFAAPGETLFTEGALGENLYIIEEGHIEISSIKDGQRRVLAVFGPGDCFGEMALIDCQPRSATATALEPTRLCALNGNTLFELYRFDVEQFAVMQMNISREVIRRLRQAARNANDGSAARLASDRTQR